MKIKEPRPQVHVERRPAEPESTPSPAQQGPVPQKLARRNSAFETPAVKRADAGPVRRDSGFEHPRASSSHEVPAVPRPPAPTRAWTERVRDAAAPALGRATERARALADGLAHAAGSMRADPREAFGVQLDVNRAQRLLGEARGHAKKLQAGLTRAEAAVDFGGFAREAAGARGGLTRVRELAGEAGALLDGAAARARHGGLDGAADQLTEVQQQAEAAGGEVGLAVGRAGAAADGAQLTPQELEGLGSGFGSAGPKQAVWSEKSMLYPRAREQGILTPELDAKINGLANGALPGAEKKQFTPVDVAQLAKQLGLPPGKLDPNQLGQAARFVSEASDPQNQRDRIAMAMANLSMVANDRLPNLQKSDVAWMAQENAKIPYKAFNDVKGDVNAELQKIAGALNTPGKTDFKVGKYNVTTTVSETGKLESTKAKKPGFFSKVVGVIKKLAPVVLTVASFIPATAPFARAIQAGISLYKAVKAKSLTGIVGAAAGALGGAGGVLGKVAKIAGGAAKALQGVKQLKQGGVAGLLGGLATVAGGVASGLGAASAGLTRAADKLGTVAQRLGQAAAGAGAVEGYLAADKAVAQAKQALAAARASGDPAAVALAQKQLDVAERSKKGALLGGLATGAGLAAGAAGGGLKTGLAAAGRGLAAAGNVVNRDFESAAANALGLAASLKKGPDTRLDASGKARSDVLHEASAMADAAVGYHKAGQAEGAANAQVALAERALQAARGSGDAAAIAQATADLKRAKQGAEAALLGAAEAGDALLGTARGIGENRAAGKAAERVYASTKEAADSLRESSDRAAGELEAAAKDPRASATDRQAAAAQLDEVRQARAALEKAVRTGDAGAIEAAGSRLSDAEVDARAATQRLQKAQTRRFADEPETFKLDLSHLRADAPAGAGAPAGTQVTVKRGDALEKIAAAHGLTVDDLLLANPQITDRNKIREGQVITVPAETADPVAAAALREVRALAQAARETAPAPAAATGPGAGKPVPEPVTFRTPAASEPGSSLSADDMIAISDKFPTWSRLMEEIAIARGEARSPGGRVNPALADLTKEQVVLLDRFTQGAIGAGNVGRVGAAVGAPVIATVGAALMGGYELAKSNPTFSRIVAGLLHDDQFKVDGTTSEGRLLNVSAVIAGWNHGIVTRKPVR